MTPTPFLLLDASRCVAASGYKQPFANVRKRPKAGIHNAEVGVSI